jgi:hypothetical protein
MEAAVGKATMPGLQHIVGAMKEGHVVNTGKRQVGGRGQDAEREVRKRLAAR